MSVRTKCSDTTHPLFKHNCPPKGGKDRTFSKKSTLFKNNWCISKKNVLTETTKQIEQCRIRGPTRPAINKTTRRDKQQI